jgi:N-acetylglucosamine-6-phosphate deacetylase
MKGFLDIHTHGLGRYDTRTDKPDHILKIARSHFRKGTRAILPAIYSASIKDMRLNMEAVRKAMEAQKKRSRIQDTRYKSKSDDTVIKTQIKHPDSCVVDRESCILGVHLEGPFLNPVRCGAQDSDSFLKPSLSSLKKLISGYEDIIKVITIAPELPGALTVTEKCASLDIRVNMGHSDATHRQAIEGKKAGATGITHIFNTMKPFHHREPGLIGLGLLDEDLYIEVIADMVHMDAITLKMIFSIKRLDRIILVSDSVKGLKDAKGHIYTKAGVLAGSSVTLADAVDNAIKTGITEAVVLETAIDNPGRYLGVQIRGGTHSL